MAWLPLVVLALGQITVRLVVIAGRIWQERVHAESHCAQMRSASASGVVLVEWRRDGAGLAIVPRDLASCGGDAAAGPASEETPVA